MSDKFVTGSTVAGTYKVLDFMGEGGMGMVYKVEHTLLAKEMAFKVLKTEVLSDAVWRRFRVEAQAIARLDNPNIVKIYDMSQTDDGLPFFTMDLLEGQSLAEYLLERKRLTVAQALPIFRQVCSGLAYAHDRGIIHRDIKPGNIMLLRGKDAAPIAKSQVKIVDFGIAKLIDDGNGVQQGLTRPGEVFGSPLYMSPEQCRGVKLDHRSDIYSLGITMFQALTGAVPFRGKSFIETVAMHQSEAAPLLSEAAEDIEFPEALEEIVDTMLAKSPDDRYDSLADVAQKLVKLEKSKLPFSSYSLPSQQTKKPSGKRADNGKEDNDKEDDGDDKFDDDRDEEADDDENEEIRRAAPNQKLQIGIISAIALAAITGASIVAYQQIKHSSKALPVVAPPIRDNEPVTPKGITDKEFNRDASALREKNPEVEKYLAQKNPPFSHFAVVEGKRVKIFDFPQTFSLGRGSYEADKRKLIVFPLQGRQMTPANVALKIEGADLLGAYPQLLRQFRPDEVFWFYIKDVDPGNPELTRSLAHLTRIRSLELPSDQLTNKDLEALNGLKNLTSLSITKSFITGDALAKSPWIRRLGMLLAENLTNTYAVLEALRTSENIQAFDLNNSDLDSAGIKIIVSKPHIWSLSLRHTNITNADVEALTVLPLLKKLNIEQCNHVDHTCLASLKKFKNLKSLQISEELFSDEEIADLQKALPELKISE